MTMQMTPSILLALVLLFGTLIVFSSALPSDDDGDNEQDYEKIEIDEE